MTSRPAASAGVRVADLTVDELVAHLEVVPMRPLLLTRNQAADLLALDRHRVGELVRDGHLRTVRVGAGPRDVRVPREEVERLAREGVPSREKRPRRTRKQAPAPGDLTALEGWEP